MSATEFEAESGTIRRGTIPSKGKIKDSRSRYYSVLHVCASEKEGKKKKEKRTPDWTWLRLRLSSAYI